MTIRALYLAVPALALGIACSHRAGGSARAGNTTASGEATASTDAATDPSASMHGGLKGHPSDETLSGRINQASSDQLVVETNEGRQETLHLAEQTAVMIDGQEARASDLQPGSSVRASYNRIDGKNMAIKIHAMSGSGGHHGMGSDTGSSDTATPSDAGPTDGTGSTGSGTWDSGSSSGTGSVSPGSTTGADSSSRGSTDNEAAPNSPGGTTAGSDAGQGGAVPHTEESAPATPPSDSTR